jgi:hypothetical protein
MGTAIFYSNLQYMLKRVPNTVLRRPESLQYISDKRHPEFFCQKTLKVDVLGENFVLGSFVTKVSVHFLKSAQKFTF